MYFPYSPILAHLLSDVCNNLASSHGFEERTSPFCPGAYRAHPDCNNYVVIVPEAVKSEHGETAALDCTSLVMSLRCRGYAHHMDQQRREVQYVL
mmetsp:Transcript_16882/g.30238  ORF Transcript_16882/g.30238 Transcript_16882/m.30238 type:complete len:95 (+) Transcript_16882:1171-1455(+)